MKNHHYLLLLQGIIGITLGAVLIIEPIKTLVVVTWAIGAFLIVDAILLIIYSFFAPDKNHKELYIIEGILALVFGLLIIAWPDQALKVAVYFFAVWALAMGIVQIAKGLFGSENSVAMVRISILTGLFGLLIGFVLFAFPLQTVALAQIIIGLIILIFGISTFLYSFEAKK